MNESGIDTSYFYSKCLKKAEERAKLCARPFDWRRLLRELNKYIRS